MSYVHSIYVQHREDYASSIFFIYEWFLNYIEVNISRKSYIFQYHVFSYIFNHVFPDRRIQNPF